MKSLIFTLAILCSSVMLVKPATAAIYISLGNQPSAQQYRHAPRGHAYGYDRHFSHGYTPVQVVRYVPVHEVIPVPVRRDCQRSYNRRSSDYGYYRSYY